MSASFVATGGFMRGKRVAGHVSVLVIDDEPGIREMLSYELAQEGFEVETADSGLAAVAAVKRRKFDLAVTDLKMPGMDGVQTLEALRELDPDIEVIVATGYASVETVVACMKRGAYDYIQKPYDPAELALLLDRASQKNHLQGVVALYEASRTLLSTLNPAELVRIVGSLAQQVLRADDVQLLLWREESQRFDFEGQTLGEAPGREFLQQLAGLAMEARAPLRFASPPLPTLTAFTGGGAYSSALVYPLAAQGRILGVLVALRRSRSPQFSASELQKGTVFAGQLAVSLDNAHLHEELAGKISELLTTREELVRAEKLSLAGQLAGAVAHEVNNPLSYVQANLQSLRDYASLVEALWGAAKRSAEYLLSQASQEAREHADNLYAAGGGEQQTERFVREVSEIIHDSLEGVTRIGELVAGFSRLAEPQQTGPGVWTDVNEIIGECVSALQRMPDARAPEVSAETTPCMAVIVREDLRTALQHLLKFLASPERKRADRPGTLLIRSAWEGGRAAITITDETLELSEEECRRIFDPRIELDSSGRTMRLNLALAMTYQLLRRGGVEMATTVEPEHGFTLRILLPPPPEEQSRH